MTTNPAAKPPLDEPKQDVARVQPPKPPLAGGGKIMAIVPDNFDSVYRLATAIAHSGMVPKSYVDKDQIINTAGIAVAIMHGLEVGLTPMASLQSIAVVNGMPTIWGDGALGLVQASGLLEDIEETVDLENGVPVLARCRVKRRDRKQWVEQMFTRAEAQKAGLWSKKGPWESYPRRMMQMRARSWALRDAFPDVLRGLGVREEVADMVDVTDRGSHTVSPVEPTRDQFRARVTDADADQGAVIGETTDQSNPASTGAPAGDVSNTGAGAASEAIGAQDEEPDWVIPNGPTEKQVEAFLHMIGATRGLVDHAAIRKTNDALLKKWGTGKVDSAYAKALATVDAAFEEKAKTFQQAA